MDNNIRNLIHTASGEKNVEALAEAYAKLKNERQAATDKVDSVLPDLFVLCAETAFELGKAEMAEECIKMFFMKTPPSNQFLCRAYLCQAQLNAPVSSKNPEKLDKAVEFLLKAINFSKKNSRYYFLVYNASVLYWQFCRPFLKSGYRQYLAKSLHQVVKALDDIDDKDYDWRAQLMIALIECHVDAGRKDDAIQISNATLSFTKSYVPSLFTTVLGLQIRHRLIDISKVSRDIKTSNELHAFYKIQRLRTMIDVGEKIEKVDIPQELGKIYKLIVKGTTDTDRSSTEMSNVSLATPGSLGKAVSPMISSGIPDKVPLLIDLTRLCLENDNSELAADCLAILRGPSILKDPSASFEIEFLKFDLMVKSLGDKQELYSKNVVETRIQAIKKLEQYLITATRLGNPNIIQAGCVTLWNLSLPLLQPNLRHHVRKPLTLVAQSLEDIDSLLVLLRCQVHMELAKCEEDEDQLEYALTHLQKALDMDDTGQYHDRLTTALTRLKLRATLYQTPDRPEDLAAMIIEQAQSSNDSSTVRMKRASLVKAGVALSPDAFMQVLDSESDTKDPSTNKGPPTVLNKLAGRANQFQTAVSKASGHLKRLGNENDQERIRIWADLAKTARKQHVWDVTRVAARFCLLYDNGRWSKRGASGRSIPQEEDKEEGEDSTVPAVNATADKPSSTAGDSTGMKVPQPPGMIAFKKEHDLLRTLAEVHFIYAEALVHLLRSEGVQLGDSPIPPEDTVKLRPKRYEEQQVNVEELPEWAAYRDWILSLSKDAIYSFQRAAELGEELIEPWIICNSAVYLWNYTNHILTQGRFKEIVAIYEPVLNAMKTTGHAGETVLMCQVSNAIAQGLMQPWIPSLSTPKVPSAATTKDKNEKGSDKGAKGRQSGKGAKGGQSKMNTQVLTVDPEGMPDLKKALDVLEYIMNVTNGGEPNNLVPISVRQPLIKNWVFCKQLLNQPIPKNYGHDDENAHSQGPMSKALCAVEMISLQGNGLPEIPQCPTLPEVVKMVEQSIWSDHLVELEMWSRLAVLAYNQENHQLVLQCGGKAMAFTESDQCLTKKQPKKVDSVFKHKVIVEQELLYYASVVMGQSLIKNMQGRNDIRRDALICFVNACRFGQQANNYDLVITAARHYWNAIKPFIGETIERELLKDPLEAVLGCIAAVADKGLGKDDEDEEEEEAEPKGKKDAKAKPSKPVKSAKDKKGKDDKKKDKGDKGKPVKTPAKIEKTESREKPKEDEKAPPLPSAYDEDLMMRAAMYGVLFQAYADKCDWEQGLRAMDQAVKDMPRTHHRLLIFKHRVITNAKLGRNVVFDMGKFKNESDDVISSMWRHVALNSKDPLDQLSAYQNAIEVLENPESDWQKVDYLVEFGEWLFVNEYPGTDAVDQFLWAADILLNKSAPHHSPVPDSDKMSQSSVDAAKYVPRERQSVIGQRPSEVSIKTDDITDIRQLETLFRINVMVAQVAGRSSPCYTDYILLAYGFVNRILQVSIHSAEKMIRDGGKPGEMSPAKKGKEKTKEAQAKPEKPGAKSALPSFMEGWSTFELPEKLQEFFKCDITGTMICKDTLKKPMLTLHYLDVLLSDICELGYHHLGLPVIAFSQMVADLILQHEHLTRLVHLKMVELCQQLNLLSGVSFHEKAAGSVFLTEQDQAQSREEIEMWMEKQRQVTFEEERTRASKSVLFENKTSNLNNKSLVRSRGLASGSEKSRGPGSAVSAMRQEPLSRFKRVISGVNNRQIWTAQAEILIRQGHYQTARQLLYEANISARAFDDRPTLTSILVQLAILGLAESNWGQAVALLLEAQKLQGDQKFWLDTTLLMIEACLCKTDKHSMSPNKPAAETIDKTCSIISEAKSLFQSLSEENPNKANMADYIEAVLEARLGSLLAENLLHDTQNGAPDQDILTKYFTASQYLSGASEKLLQLGYRREAVKVMIKEASIKHMFANGTRDAEQQHRYLMEAYGILREATNIADAVMSDVFTSSSLYEMRHVSLPVQRESVQVRLQLTSLMVEMFSCYSQEVRAKREHEARKGSMQKLIDDFVCVDKSGEDEDDWEKTCRSLVVDTMLQLSLANGMASGITQLKAKIMYNLGICLRALSKHTSPDADEQWKQPELIPDTEFSEESTNAENPNDGNNDDNEAGNDNDDDAGKSRDLLKYTAQAISLKQEFESSRRYMSHAVECLSQAVHIGLKASLRDVVGQACHQLVECVGVYDPSTAVQYLALYQSCYMSQCLEKVLYSAQSDPSLSRQAALLRQRKILIDIEYLSDRSSSVLSASLHHLGDHCEAWKRLSIMEAHLQLTKEFSVTNMQFVVLQHSPDRQYLYGAILDKGRSATQSAKATKQSGAGPAPNKAIISRAKVNPDDLDNLIEEFKHFKSETSSEMMRRNYSQKQREQQTKMLGRMEDNMEALSEMNVASETNIADQESRLEAHFQDIVAAMEAYLDPVLTKLQPALSPDTISDTVVLLADDYILRLPLECLKTFLVPRVTSFTRDFSLQFMYYRLHHNEDGEAKGDGKKGGGKKGKPEKPSTAKSKPSEKKGGKDALPAIPKDGPVVDINAVRYIVDLYNECDNEDDVNSPAKVVTELIAKYKTVASKWTGVMGTEHLPSIGECQRLLLESSAFFFYGPERCLGALPPYMLAPMSLTECNVAFIMDLIHTTKSFPRQSRIDAPKSVNALSLENPLEAAMLFSLSGVGCVVTNSWYGQFQDVKTKLTRYFTALLEETKTVGQAVRSLIEFPEVPHPEQDTESTSEKGSKHTEGRRNSVITGKTSLPERQPPIDPPRHWFNTVVYGAPSVLLTQTKT